MSGISLCILGGTFASNIFYLATYTGSGSPQFVSLSIDSTNSYFSGPLNGGSGNEQCLVKVNAKGEIQYQKNNYKSAESILIWSSASSTNNLYFTGYEYASGYYGTLIKADKSSGAMEWIKRVRNSGVSYTRGVAVDSSENSYVAGETTFSRGGGLIVKYNSGGTLQWQKQLGGSSSNPDEVTIRGLTLDSSNNVYVTGMGAASGTQSLLLVKYNSSGTLQWQRQIVFADQSKGIGVATDSSNNVYVAGWAIISTVQSIVLVKYNSSGTLQWQRQIVYASASQVGQSNSSSVIAIDSSDNIYLAGELNVSPQGWRWAVLKYNSAGTLQWQRMLYPDTNYSVYANSIAVDNLGAFIISSVVNNAFAAKFPVTGALTGTYTVGSRTVTYDASSGTESAASGTASTPTYTDQNASIPDADGNYVYTATNSLTYTRLEIP